MQDTTKKPAAHERRPNLWEAKGTDPTTGRRKSYYGSSAEEASKKAARSLRPVDDDTLAAYYFHAYVPTIAGRSDNWIEQIIWAMEKYVLPAHGETAIADIDRRMAQASFNRWARTLAPESLRHVRTVWSAVMNLALEDEAINRNPLRKVRIARGEPKQFTVLRPHELWRLATGCSPLIRPVVLIQGFAGLRIGEACALTWHHLEDGVLRVREQVLQPKGGAVITTKLKTPQSKRDIPLHPELVLMLTDCGQTSSLYVCSNDSGGFLTPKAAYSRLRKESQELGLPPMGTHDLRHTFTSLLENEFEAPRRVVDAILGRAGSGTTDSYSHTFREQLQRWQTVYWERVSTQSTTEKRRTAGLYLD